MYFQDRCTIIANILSIILPIQLHCYGQETEKHKIIQKLQLGQYVFRFVFVQKVVLSLQIVSLRSILERTGHSFI